MDNNNLDNRAKSKYLSLSITVLSILSLVAILALIYFYNKSQVRQPPAGQIELSPSPTPKLPAPPPRPFQPVVGGGPTSAAGQIKR